MYGRSVEILGNSLLITLTDQTDFRRCTFLRNLRPPVKSVSMLITNCKTTLTTRD